MILSGSARLAGVIGWPVSHSLSPRLHGYWLQEKKIDGAYLPLAIEPDKLKTCLPALRDMGFRGVNLTLPHKILALGLCDEVTAEASEIGAVNTIRFDEGRILGSNTDAFGFLESLKEAVPDLTLAGKRALLLGGGGAARAVLAALLGAGIAEVVLCNRSRDKAEYLQAKLSLTTKCDVSVKDWAERGQNLDGLDLLVNSTSLGMVGQDPLEMSLEGLSPSALVADIVYRPLETDLLARARARGNACVDGLGMLLHQARPGFAAWFGEEPQVTPELRGFVLEAVD
jgi:shikimate dehydrogenase